MSNSRQSESPSQPSVGSDGSRSKKGRQKRRGKGRKTEAKESLTPISKYLVKEEPPAPPTTQPSTSNTQRADDDDENRASTLAGPSTTERSDETRGGNGGQLEPTPPKAVAREAVVEQGGRKTSGKDGGGIDGQPEKRKGEGGGGRQGVKASSSSSSRSLVQERERRERKVEPKRSTDTPVVRRQVQSSIRDHFPVRRSGRKTKSEVEKEDFEKMAQRLRNKDESGLKVVEVEGKGRGVVSTRRFSRGELVCEYSGELISLEEAREREVEYGKDPSVGCYMYYFSHNSNKLCVDATADNGRKGRLLNHSRTAANVVTRLAEVDGQPYLCLVAARDISVGEQLEYDYGERDRATMDSHPWLAS